MTDQVGQNEARPCGFKHGDPLPDEDDVQTPAERRLMYARELMAIQRRLERLDRESREVQFNTTDQLRNACRELQEAVSRCEHSIGRDVLTGGDDA